MSRGSLRFQGLSLAVLLLVAVATACGPGNAPAATSQGPGSQGQKVAVAGGSYTNVSPAQLASMLKGKDFPLINVHIPYEGEIVPTDAHIPYNEIEANLGKLPADRGAKVVLYCRSGSMSDQSARTLVKLGYTNVWNLAGGMIEWKAAGYALK